MSAVNPTSSALHALVARQGERTAWEKAIDQLQWYLLNHNSIPNHARATLITKAEVLRRQPEFATMSPQAGYSFEHPFNTYVSEEHWQEIKSLAQNMLPPPILGS